jgi:heparan-alpha-glucosaminide N-acetyltransferase
LGYLTSSVCTYIGLSTGHFLIHYASLTIRVKKFLFYFIIYLLLGLFLSNFSINDGWIPINKSLWSISYVFLLVSFSFLILLIFYLSIDIIDFYSGTPFLYFGRNSITIYFLHLLLEILIPIFKFNDYHASLLYSNYFGILLWFLVAFLMNYFKIYINL